MHGSSTQRRRLGAILAAAATAAVALATVGPPALAAPATTHSAADTVVTSGDARFEVLSSTVIRTEYAGDGAFVDASTFNAIGRDDFTPATFTQSEADGWLTIDTGKVSVKYRVGSGAFQEDNLIATLRTGQQDVVAHPWSSALNCAVGSLCEAEDLTLDGLHLDSNHDGYTGKGFEAGFENTGNSLTLRTNVETAGSFDFAVRYADGATTPPSRTLSFSVDGKADQTITFPNTGNWNSWALAKLTLDLAAGTHTLVVHRAATDDGQLNVDSVALVKAGDPYPAPRSTVSDCAFGAICEGEQSSLTGSARVATDHNGYSGAGFVAELVKNATFTAHVTDVPAAGSYDLQLRYASGVSDRPATLAIGDAAPTSLTLAKTSSWDSWRTIAIPVTLAAGDNDVKFTCAATDSCGFNIDTIAVAESDASLLAPHAALGGYRRGLDQVNGAALTTPGLLFQDGWYLLDDTPSALFDATTGDITPRGDHDGESYQDGYLFGYGQDYEQALTDLATLTGPSVLLPRWAYGVWYSEYYNHTASDFENTIVPTFRSQGVPLDVLVSDTDFKSPDPWDGWEIDTNKFPDPKAFFDWAESQGIHNTMNIHPSILSSDPQFAQAQATAKNKLTKNNAGCNSDLGHGADCYTFDWSDPDQLKAYFDLHQTMETQGVDFWWLDWCCEQSVASQKGVTPDAWINQQYATDSDKTVNRGFAFSRAFGSLQAGGYSGQAAVPTGPWADKRTTVHFTGDSTSSWGTLAMEVGYTPGEAASTGLSAVSHDIGGFNNDGSQAQGAEPGSTKLPDDLYARWVQLGAFQPIDRLHSNHSDRLPWQYGTDAKNSAEKFLNLRENLVPYTYGLAKVATKTGVPVTRPLYLQYPDQQEAYANASSEYLYGPDVLVAPVTAPGSSATTSVWFPAGSSWTDWFTGKTYAGGTTAKITTQLDTMPVFTRSGGIVATRTGNVTNDEQNPLDAVTVTAAGGADGSYSLFEDDGKTTDSSKSATTPITYTERGTDHTLSIGAQDGTFDGKVSSRAWTAKFTDAAKPTSVSVNGARVASSAWTWDADSRTVTVKLDSASTATPTTVSYSTAAALTPVTPKITGTAKVGSTLTATPGTWASTTPKFTYQWKRNGSAISGATSKSYVLTAKDLGARITVRVTGSLGDETAVKESAQTAKVVAGTMTAHTPKISGKAKVGHKLTAVPGTWKPAGVHFTYRWYHSGKAIKSATKSTYTPTKSDAGKSIKVKVTGTKTGYSTTAKSSKSTSRVAK